MKKILFVALVLSILNSSLIPNSSLVFAAERYLTPAEIDTVVSDITAMLKNGQTANYVIGERVSVDSVEIIQERLKKKLFKHYFNIEVLWKKDVTYVDMPKTRNNYLVNRRIDKMAASICKKISRKASGMEKVRKINSLICSKMSVYENTTSKTILKNFRKWKGNCVGYSMLFKACCEKMKIKCRSVTGLAYKTEPHMWSKVKVGGRWYYVDTIFNDSLHTSRYFLSRKLWPTHKVTGVSAS